MAARRPKTPLLAQILQNAESWPVPPGVNLPPDVEELHALASAAKRSYRDPSTGYSVFPVSQHLARGVCCGNACRHCPFGHFTVPPEYRKARIASAVLLRPKGCPAGPYSSVICFAPGPAAIEAIRRCSDHRSGDAPMRREPALLVTPFDPASYRCEPWSSWPLTAAMDAAAALEMPLLPVPYCHPRIGRRGARTAEEGRVEASGSLADSIWAAVARAQGWDDGAAEPLLLGGSSDATEAASMSLGAAAAATSHSMPLRAGGDSAGAAAVSSTADTESCEFVAADLALRIRGYCGCDTAASSTHVGAATSEMQR
jgi:hypothetical protein